MTDLHTGNLQVDRHLRTYTTTRGTREEMDVRTS